MGVLGAFVLLLASLQAAAFESSEESASLLRAAEFGTLPEAVTLGADAEGVLLLSMGAWQRTANAQELRDAGAALAEAEGRPAQRQAEALDACGTTISSEDVDAAFDKFRTEHSRIYEPGSEEYQQRHALFEQHLRRIREINCGSRATWRAGVNKYADRTPKELSQLRGYLRPGGQGQSLVDVTPSFLQTDMVAETDQAPLPKSVDWRHLPAMSHVKEQGDCGSCWAFAASSVLSAHSELYEASSRTFSPQHLVQCVANPHKCGGAGGCEGATVELAMEHALKRGVATAESIPYTGQQPAPPCPADDAVSMLRRPNAPENGFAGFRKLPENEEEPILRALQDGPVTASVMAEDTWFDYEGGIHPSCPKNAMVNHAVVLAGYGEELLHGRVEKYWLIQNSWGPRWGEGGFLRLQRHDDEAQHCGWDLDPSQGNGCEDGPEKVWVCGSCGIISDAVRPVFTQGAQGALMVVHAAAVHELMLRPFTPRPKGL